MLVERPTTSTPRQLRQFAAAIMAAAAIAAWRLWSRAPAPGLLATALVAVAMILGVIGLVAPRRIEWLFRALMAITWPIGLVVSELMLVVLYFGVITPIGLLMRAVGRDPLSRAIDKRSPTYWIAHSPVRDRSRYLRQS